MSGRMGVPPNTKANIGWVTSATQKLTSVFPQSLNLKLISVRALSTSFHVQDVQDVMPVTSARLADISRRGFVSI